MSWPPSRQLEVFKVKSSALVAEMETVRLVFLSCGVRERDLDDVAQDVLIAAWTANEEGRFRVVPGVDLKLAVSRWMVGIAWRQASHYTGSARFRKEVRIRRFRRVRDVTLEVGRVYVFLGANEVGKTNLLEAIAVLGAAASGTVDAWLLRSRGGRPKWHRQVPFLGRGALRELFLSELERFVLYSPSPDAMAGDVTMPGWAPFLGVHGERLTSGGAARPGAEEPRRGAEPAAGLLGHGFSPELFDRRTGSVWSDHSSRCSFTAGRAARSSSAYARLLCVARPRRLCRSTARRVIRSVWATPSAFDRARSAAAELPRHGG